MWDGAKILADDADEPKVADLIHRHKNACAWAVIEPGDTARIDKVIERFGLDEWVRRDLTTAGGWTVNQAPDPDPAGSANQPSRPKPQIKYEEFDRVGLVLSVAVELPADPESRDPLIVRKVALVTTPRLLLLVVAGDRDRAQLCRRLTELHDRLVDGGAERAMQVVLHALINTYAVVVESVAGTSDDLADSLFDMNPLSNAEKKTAFRLRRTVTELRRVTGPMRELVENLGQSSEGDSGSISRSWNLLMEHQKSTSESADDLRDSLNALFDTSLAFDDSRMNEVMKKLTGWAAIVAAPTLITGFVGMNVPFWLNGQNGGFYAYLMIMLVAVVVLFVVMKVKKWI